MISKVFERLSLLVLVGLLGLFACVRSPEAEPAPDPLSESAIELPSALAAESDATGQGICCIDYYCPATGFEITGCKAGGIGPGSAFRACADACGRYCEASGWYCD